MLPQSTRRCPKCGERQPQSGFDISPRTGKPFTYCRSCRLARACILRDERPDPNPSGLCQCGCGQPAPIAKQTDGNRGFVKGKHHRFVRGHNARTMMGRWEADGRMRCWRCMHVLPFDQFAHRLDTASHRQGWCIACERKKQADRRERYREEGRRLMSDAKAAGCALCGERDPVVLQFHHRKPVGRKGRFQRVPVLVGHGKPPSWVKREIARCVVLCANCHLRVHAGNISLGDTI